MGPVLQSPIPASIRREYQAVWWVLLPWETYANVKWLLSAPMVSLEHHVPVAHTLEHHIPVAHCVACVEHQ